MKTYLNVGTLLDEMIKLDEFSDKKLNELAHKIHSKVPVQEEITLLN